MQKNAPRIFRFFAAVGKVFFVLDGTKHYSTMPNKSQEEGGACLENYYRCEQIAKHYGVHVVTVWRWIRKGELSALKIGKQYLVTDDSLKSFERKHCTHS